MIKPPAAYEDFIPPPDEDLGELYRPTAACPYTPDCGCLQSEDVPGDWHCLNDSCWEFGLAVKDYLIEQGHWRESTPPTDAMMAAAYEYVKSLANVRDKPPPLIV